MEGYASVGLRGEQSKPADVGVGKRWQKWRRPRAVSASARLSRLGLGQLAGFIHAVAGTALLDGGEGAGQQGDGGDDGDGDEYGAHAAGGAAFLGRLGGLCAWPAATNSASTERGQRHRGVPARRLAPGGGRGTARRCRAHALPGPGGVAEVAQAAQAVTVVVEPAPQPRPLADQRLVGHLDGRLPGQRVAVEGQQPGRAEAFDDR